MGTVIVLPINLLPKLHLCSPRRREILGCSEHIVEITGSAPVFWKGALDSTPVFMELPGSWGTVVSDGDSGTWSAGTLGGLTASPLTSGERKFRER